MLGDVLLITEVHKEAAREIKNVALKDWEAKRKKYSNEYYRYIVAISGESGSGKSELSHSLSKFFKEDGIRVKILHTDNYYKIPPMLRAEWRNTKGLHTVGLSEYNWDLIDENIDDFKNGRKAKMPCIDIIPEQVDQLITDFDSIQMLVIDGLYAINVNQVDLKIFIELTYHETKMAQITRMKEPMNPYRKEVLEREHQSVNSLKHLADYYIDKNYDLVKAKKPDSPSTE
ncbi:MAG: uridine kinase family protein [bacterium]